MLGYCGSSAVYCNFDSIKLFYSSKHFAEVHSNKRPMCQTSFFLTDLVEMKCCSKPFSVYCISTAYPGIQVLHGNSSGVSGSEEISSLEDLHYCPASVSKPLVEMQKKKENIQVEYILRHLLIIQLFIISCSFQIVLYAGFYSSGNLQG